MAREIAGAPQNTIYLNTSELTIVTFANGEEVEMMNISGGTIWMKWHDDFTPVVSGDTSTPLMQGVAYYRKRFPLPAPIKIGFLAESTALLALNIVA